jgi:polyisoprenoid-binding protein YceI
VDQGASSQFFKHPKSISEVSSVLNWKTRVLTGGLGLAVLGLLGGVALWYFVFDTDAAAPVSLDDAIESDDAAGGSAAQGGQDGLTGDWMLVSGGSSFAGYRVGQQVAGIGGETVVGRTDSVEGSLSFDGTAITSTEVTVDMAELNSGESLRDNVLRSQAIETGRFPTASFVLTRPIPVNVPAEGEMVSQTVSGDLTLHGVTRPVEVDVQAVLRGERLIVVGSSEVQFGDFNISPPRGPAQVLSVEDNGIMEVQLTFERGDSSPHSDSGDRSTPSNSSPGGFDEGY